MEFTTTIGFKSFRDIFKKEQADIKNNIVRIVSENEDKEIQRNLLNIKYIEISLEASIYPDTFTRKLKDITRCEEDRIIIYIFTWEV